MNVSITSWDMVGDSEEAVQENGPLGSIEGIESEVDGLSKVKPHESEECHTLEEK
jgi:hypothetical protein